MLSNNFTLRLMAFTLPTHFSHIRPCLLIRKMTTFQQLSSALTEFSGDTSIVLSLKGKISLEHERGSFFISNCLAQMIFSPLVILQLECLHSSHLVCSNDIFPFSDITIRLSPVNSNGALQLLVFAARAFFLESSSKKTFDKLQKILAALQQN